MYWLIALLVVGLIAVLGYRYYQHPPLSRDAKQQRERYIMSLQHQRTFIYRMTPEFIRKLNKSLGKKHFNAGDGCFQGQNVIIYLKTEGTQVTLFLFCPTEEELTRHAWRITRLVKNLGGNASATSHG